MEKKRQVPEVFRRAYGDGARPLGDVILGLLPSPLLLSTCPCDGTRCLRCMGPADRSSAILRPDDPVEYRRLLTRACAVVSDRAPPLLAFDPTPHHDQRYIIQSVIDEMLSDSSKSSNMICAGNKKGYRTSNVMDDLSDLAWSLLLKRIGDNVMVHLLQYSSIFLFLPSNNHFQVTGDPMYKSLSRISNCMTERLWKRSSSQNQQSLLTTGPLKKIILENREKFNSTIGVEMDISCSSRSTKNCNGSISCETNAQSKKRFRPFSWQRCRKRRNTNSLTCDNVPQKLVQGGCVLSGVVLNSSLGKLNERTHPDLSDKVATFQPFEKKSSSCHCRMMLQQTPHGRASGVEIGKRWMFYNPILTSSLFPKDHILNRLKPDDKGAASLMRDIFSIQGGGSSHGVQASIHSDRFCPFGPECELYSLVPLLKSLIRRVHRCPYLKILNKHCRFPTLKFCGERNNGKMSEEREIGPSLSIFRVITLQKKKSHLKSLSNNSKSYVHFSNREAFLEKSSMSDNQFENLNEAYCQKQQVVSFIWAICRSIFALDFIGTPTNWRALRRNISRLVHLRRFEKFSLSQCLSGLKTSQVPFLSKITCLSSCQVKNVQVLKRILFERWIFWFFSHAVVPIVATHFYVTESETGRHNVFYYEKQVWRKINDAATAHLRRTSYHLFHPHDLGSNLRKRTLGFSKVRFIPKERGFRPLMNLRAPSTVLLSGQKVCLKTKHVKVTCLRDCEVINFRSVNSNICDLRAILKRIKVENSDNLGSSVFDYNDIYERFCPFITRVRRLTITPRLFIVGCDVSKAFDTIDQDVLMDLMKEIFQKDEYHLHKVAAVHCTKDIVRVHYDQVAVDVGNNENMMQYTSLVPARSSHCVHVNQFRVKQIKNQRVFHLLQEHVKGNLVVLGRSLYLQQVGIPQGSVLSSLLCSFYFASLEKEKIFPWLDKVRFEKSGLQYDSTALPEYMLLRLIDDFLFISTSKDLALDFLYRMQRGFRKYNCQMNKGKFSMNFDMRDKCAAFQTNRIYKGEDGELFLPWSGLLINCCTFEVQADYTRYWGIHMSSTITASNQAQPRLNLKRKLCDYVRPKCHPLFYDSNINGSRAVRLNAYQAFLICAMKFHCYLFAVPNLRGLCPKYSLRIIKGSISYMYKLIRRRMDSARLRYKFRPILKLKKEETVWLGLSAYIRILRKKQSRYIELLRLLKAELQIYRELESIQELQYAVDDCHSSLLWKIKF